MKKLFIPLILFAFILCGCSSEKTADPIVSGIAFDADIEFNSKSYSCAVKLENSGNTEVKVTKPSNLAGLKISGKNGKFTAEYLGIKKELNESALDSAADIILKCYDSVFEAEKKEDNNCSASGKIGDIDYIYTYSPLGLPISLSVPDKNLNAEFYNVKTIK